MISTKEFGGDYNHFNPKRGKKKWYKLDRGCSNKEKKEKIQKLTPVKNHCSEPFIIKHWGTCAKG